MHSSLVAVHAMCSSTQPCWQAWHASRHAPTMALHFSGGISLALQASMSGTHLSMHVARHCTAISAAHSCKQGSVYRAVHMHHSVKVSVFDWRLYDAQEMFQIRQIGDLCLYLVSVPVHVPMNVHIYLYTCTDVCVILHVILFCTNSRKLSKT